MYTRDDAKARGTKLRGILSDLGHEITHTHALETIARMQGYKDWNTCLAALDKKTQILPMPKGWIASGDRQESYDIGIDRSILHRGLHPSVIRYRDNAPSDGTGFATMMQSFDAVI